MFIICLRPQYQICISMGFLIAAIKINITSAVRLLTEQTNQKMISHLPKQRENSQVNIHNCFERYMTKTDMRFEMAAIKVWQRALLNINQPFKSCGSLEVNERISNQDNIYF